MIADKSTLHNPAPLHKNGAEDNLIRILLCDDDSNFLNILQDDIRLILKKLKIFSIISLHCNCENISKQELSNVDIIFLDIDFPGKTYNGLDVAKEIRK